MGVAAAKAALLSAENEACMLREDELIRPTWSGSVARRHKEAPFSVMIGGGNSGRRWYFATSALLKSLAVFMFGPSRSKVGRLW